MTAYIAIGSNLGDREGYLRAAIDALKKSESVVQTSSIYETAPVGHLDQPAFLNMVVGVETPKRPVELLTQLGEIEKSLHRKRSFPNAPRTIDLDLLLHGDAIVDTPEVTVPHPRLHERAFVLVPLVEIAPATLVPTLGRSAQELLDDLGDIKGVVYWGEY
jgi:2-amino-4-hydroxy-6-hydroxymethyldihydropteridine diphosphokinase